MRTVWLSFRSLWMRGELKREIDEELRFHLEQRALENMAAGMRPDEAARAARKRFGNLQSVREQCRKIRGASFGQATLQDLRFGLRLLAKRPGFTALAVMSLAVGIGINTAVFSFLNAALLRSVGFRDPETIIRLEGPTVCYPDYQELAKCPSLSGLVAVSGHEALLHVGDVVEAVLSESISPNYFSVLGIHALVGGVFAEGDPRLRTEQLVVISQRLWQRRFGGDPALVGKTILLSEGTYTVLGVVEPDYYGIEPMRKVDMWFVVSPFMMQTRKADEFMLLGRLGPGARLDQVRPEVKTVVDRLKLKNPFTGRPEQLRVLSERQARAEHGLDLVLMVMGIVGLVLLVACANVSGLLLARNEERRRELAVRLALGASRGRVMRQMLLESLLLSALGAAFAWLLAGWAKGAILALVPGNLIQFIPEVHLDGRVLGVTLGVALLATIVFGLLPAWHAARTDVGAILKGEAAHASLRWKRPRGRDLLIVGQLTISVIFLLTAALLVRAFARANALDLGFEKKAMLQLLIPGIRAHSDQLLERISQLPGVSQVGLALRAPLALSGGGAMEKIFPAAGGVSAGTEGQNIGFNVVTPNYFNMMGIRFLRGRPFSARDSATAPHVVIISEATARHYWPAEDPLGKVVHFDSPSGPGMEIVGVVRDVVRNQIGETPDPFVYFPESQRPLGETTLLLETRGEPRSVLVNVRHALLAFDPRLEPYMVDTQKEVIQVALLPQKATAWLFGVLGLLAFALATAGLYGVVAYSVTRRTHEFGLRVALGAQPAAVMKMVLRQGLILALIGLACGLPCAWGIGRLMQSGIYGVNPTDPPVFLGASAVIIGVVLAASFFPARRAARIHPMDALRCE